MDLWSIQWGPSAMGICAFFYIRNALGVLVLHKSMVNWRVVHLPCLYVHPAIHETSWVKQCSMDLWSIWWGRSISHGYMCILLYMKIIEWNSFAWIYTQLGGMCPSAMGKYAFCYTWNLLSVTDLHGSMLNLGVHQPWVYVHSAIHENYWV